MKKRLSRYILDKMEEKAYSNKKIVKKTSKAEISLTSIEKDLYNKDRNDKRRDL